MSSPPVGESVELVPVSRAVAEALLAGSDCGEQLAPGYPHADTADALRAFLAGGCQAGTFLIRRRRDALVVGDCGTVGGPDDDGAVEIGYGLAASARGAGLATDAVRSLSGWLLGRPGVRRVVAETHQANVRSRAVLERAGFVVTDADGVHVRYELPTSP